MDNTKQKATSTEQRGNTVTKPPVSPNKGNSTKINKKNSSGNKK